MQNTFSQSGNDSKWFSKTYFRIGMWHSRPPPFMARAILDFHFDYLKPSLSRVTSVEKFLHKRLFARRSLRRNRTTFKTITTFCRSLSRTWDRNFVVGREKKTRNQVIQIALLLNILMQVKKPTAFYSVDV